MLSKILKIEFWTFSGIPGASGLQNYLFRSLDGQNWIKNIRSPFIIIHNYESSTDLLVKSEPEEAEFLIGLYNVPSKHANDQEVVKTITSKCKFCDSSFSTKTNLNHMYPQSMKERSHSNVKFATIVAVENFTWINMLPQTMKEKSHSNVKFVTMAV